MSATNHTTNYNLPQFVGSDKPAWLGDVNPAMNAIDTAMHANAVKAQQAIENASVAQSTADTAEQHAQDANTNAGTAQTTANQAIANNNATQSALDAFKSLFNFTHFSTAQASGTGINVSGLKLAQDESGSVFKVYGQILINPSGSYPRTAVAGMAGYYGLATGLFLNHHPSEPISIEGSPIVVRQNYASRATNEDVRPTGFVIGTDGQIYAWVYQNTNPATTSSGELYHIIFPPCIYFNVDFGDITPDGE